MRIATWNINSVRLRLGLVEKLLQEQAPDVLCLQETKAPDEAFPHLAFEALGYRTRFVKGMKSYNGVALLSRLPFKESGARDWQGKSDCRHAFAVLQNDVEIHCFYIPAGGDVPDPALNPKFAHKLGFLDEMTSFWAEKKQDNKKRIMVGDFNIAPSPNDVWSHKQLLDVVSHTPIEVEKLGAVQKALGWVDAVREVFPEPEKLSSWWSYRARDWAVSDRGRRLDHVWVSPSLAGQVTGAEILKDARGWGPKPSDHVPVIVDIQ